LTSFVLISPAPMHYIGFIKRYVLFYYWVSVNIEFTPIKESREFCPTIDLLGDILLRWFVATDSILLVQKETSAYQLLF
ncbi:MAG: hypothetical protein ABIG84_07750, partial [archaeon]